MGWWLAYLALLLALLVRVRDPEGPVHVAPSPSPTEPLRLVAVHHALFFFSSTRCATTSITLAVYSSTT